MDEVKFYRTCLKYYSGLLLEIISKDLPRIDWWNCIFSLSLPDFISLNPQQRWKKVAAAAAPHVLIFHSCANFWFWSHVFKWFCFFVQFLASFHDFEHFLHIFCALIFQTRSFASAILLPFSISDPQGLGVCWRNAQLYYLFSLHFDVIFDKNRTVKKLSFALIRY